jgi:hypothetical protein
VAEPKTCFSCRREFTGSQLLRTHALVQGFAVRVCPMCLDERLRREPRLGAEREAVLWRGFALVLMESLERPSPLSTAGDRAARALALERLGCETTRSAILALLTSEEVVW